MKTVFITGAAGGLGIELTRQHLEAGDRVYALDLRETDALIALACPRLTFLPCDLSKTESVERAVKGAGEISEIDVLYSCAGIFRARERARLADTNLDDCASMYEINCVGFLRVVKSLLGCIGNSTAILCVTSEAGSISQNHRFQEYSYCMSKAAENMACSILRNHFSSLGMKTRVICIHPGWLRDAMGGQEALDNPAQSVTTQDSAAGLISIARDAHSLPEEDNYMDYKRVRQSW